MSNLRNMGLCEKLAKRKERDGNPFTTTAMVKP